MQGDGFGVEEMPEICTNIGDGDGCFIAEMQLIKISSFDGKVLFIRL